MPADDTVAARSHARISAGPALRAATQNLAGFTGTLYPQLGGRHDLGVQAREVRVGFKSVKLGPSANFRPTPCKPT